MWLCKCAARKGQPNVTPRTSSRSDALMLITYLALAISILMYTSWQSVFLISESCVLWRLAIRDEFGIFWVQWSNVDVTYSDCAFGAPSIAAAVTFAVTMLSMLQKTRERESELIDCLNHLKRKQQSVLTLRPCLERRRSCLELAVLWHRFQSDTGRQQRCTKRGMERFRVRYA